MRRKELEELIARLESEDAFDRLEAEARLRQVAHRDFGFRWDAPAEARGEAVSRLRTWIEEKRKRKEAARRKATQAGFQAVNLEDLKSLPPEDVEKHLQQLLAKAQVLGGFALTRPRCEECRRRPASVEVVDILPGAGAAVTRLCDACAVERGEIRE